MEDAIELACEVMHDAYEKAATGAGWETNPASRKPWADVPEANKVTMRAAVGALLDWIAETPEFYAQRYVLNSHQPPPIPCGLGHVHKI